MDTKFTRTPTHQDGKKSKFHFVKYYDYLAAALFSATAGKAGGAIYNYLKFKKGMEGDLFFKLPNEHFLVKYRINRQRKSEAITLLEAAECIETIKTTGKTTKARLRIKVIKNGE
jgi:hypothetical protein